ncbi:hypothetical protein K7I13_04095 [Brucepastera parasyntrophica]|uniref:hypothetical protein n=1 Tax=Brucepastera parasyntrophica TaxID=2880008 RepID=UPI00210C9164|nr:hypothetical protein [Brucepastera parasyntrophica]ULQ60495.1 hypothetical protein K7I13_04095 [Brucepastera parasyntrophica]
MAAYPSIKQLFFSERIAAIPSDRIYEIDVPLNGQIEDSVFLDKNRYCSFIVEFSIKYTDEPFHRITVTLLKDGAEVLKQRYIPRDDAVMTRSSQRASGKYTSQKFRGTLERVTIPEAGKYTILIESYFDENLAELDYYRFYIK